MAESGLQLSDAQMRYEIKGNDRYSLPPIHRGHVYCSPWCGVHCTRASYDRAVTDAGELAAMLGDGWTPRVWENMGWFYEAVKDIASVGPTLTGSTIGPDWTVTGYTASIDFPTRQFIQHAETPEDALGFAVQEARTFIARLHECLGALIDSPSQ